MVVPQIVLAEASEIRSKLGVNTQLHTFQPYHRASANNKSTHRALASSQPLRV
jgi:hypothetical protein